MTFTRRYRKKKGITLRKQRGGMKVIEFVKSHIGRKWNWVLLSANPSVSYEDIKANPSLPWVYDNTGVQWNPSLTLANIEELIQEKKLQPQGFAGHPAITIEFVLKYMAMKDYKTGWDWSLLSANPSIQLKDIQENPKLKWNWGSIASRNDLTKDFIEENIDKKGFDFFAGLPGSSAVDLDFVLSHPEKRWGYQLLALNPNFTIKIYLENKDTIFKNIVEAEFLRSFTFNPKFTLQDVLENKNLPWKWDAISQQVPLTMKTFVENKNLDWNYSNLSHNPTLTWDIVSYILNTMGQKPKVFDWSALSKHPNITWDIISANKDKPWSYSFLSSNPNLNWRVVEKEIGKGWDWDRLSSNPMTKAEEIIKNTQTIASLQLAFGKGTKVPDELKAFTSGLGPSILPYLSHIKGVNTSEILAKSKKLIVG